MDGLLSIVLHHFLCCPAFPSEHAGMTRVAGRPGCQGEMRCLLFSASATHQRAQLGKGAIKCDHLLLFLATSTYTANTHSPCPAWTRRFQHPLPQHTLCCYASPSLSFVCHRVTSLAYAASVVHSTVPTARLGFRLSVALGRGTDE
jgi:hypothetical protein